MTNKRGRKRKNGLYFGEEQETAVAKYLSFGKLIPHPDFPNDNNRRLWIGTIEDEISRNAIYNEFLRDAFNIMVESIIRRYKLYRKDYSFENLHSDTLSYLMLKADKFDTTKGKRAYSYYGTICKHYILGLMIKDRKMLNQTLDFDSAVSKVHEKDEFVYHLSDTDYGLADLIKTICDEIKKEIEIDGSGKKKLTENEKKVGEALIDILENWEMLFATLQGGSKFNKNVILATIRENTGLITKDIRIAMRRYKTIYELVKGNKIEGGYL
jgi:hypothetical protein